MFTACLCCSDPTAARGGEQEGPGPALAGVEGGRTPEMESQHPQQGVGTGRGVHSTFQRAPNHY